MVNVYDNDNNVIARVKYNAKLDSWNGRNMQNGGTGLHLGITKLKNGTFVLIYGTQWQGSSNYAEIVDDETALQEILKSGNSELLKTKRFASLKKLHDEQMIEEDDDN